MILIQLFTAKAAEFQTGRGILNSLSSTADPRCGVATVVMLAIRDPDTA
ncbi:MAG: hypothetical protein II836_07935 [Clostridia bacterium]|nr:hypothetical protein [Clostridia bacterium]MBQ6425855.1 hypothetical protein [Clostridia bacterium]MBR0444033.1 hypothetical protein [Clostridia bacterium]